MKPRYDLVLWDFDGTLADTLPAALETFNYLAGQHGFLPVTDPQGVRQLTMRSFISRHRIPVVKLPRLVLQFLAIQKGKMGSVRLVEGVGEVVHGMARLGVRQGVVSSNSRENIVTCLRANRVEDCFEFVVGYPRLFGKDRALRKVLAGQKLAPAQALYVGDEVRDVDAARKVGLAMAAVGWGLNAGALMVEHGATYLVDTPGELLGLVERPESPP